MARKRPVIQIDDDEWVTVEWTGQREQCCECGLTHRLDFRVAPGGKLQFRAKRV